MTHDAPPAPAAARTGKPQSLADLPHRVLLREVAPLLRVSAETLRKLLVAGEIPYLRIGKKYTMLRDDLIAWEQARRRGGQP